MTTEYDLFPMKSVNTCTCLRQKYYLICVSCNGTEISVIKILDSTKV